MGVLFRPGDVESLAAAIRTYFGEVPATRNDAAKRWADRFPWSTVVEPVGRWVQQAAAAKSATLAQGV
jgi:hypothetical protein